MSELFSGDECHRTQAALEALRDKFAAGGLSEFPDGQEDPDQVVHIPSLPDARYPAAILEGEFSDHAEIFIMCLRGMIDSLSGGTYGSPLDEGLIVSQARETADGLIKQQEAREQARLTELADRLLWGDAYPPSNN